MTPPDDRGGSRFDGADASGGAEAPAPLPGSDGTPGATGPSGDRYARLPATGSVRPASRSTNAKGFAERINRLRGDSSRIVPDAPATRPGLTLQADD